MRIDSQFRERWLAVMPDFEQGDIKNEPMLFNCDMATANRLAGPITTAFIDRIPLEWHEEPLVIDTRVHMLMPGWFPCIPGWHHDDVPRTRCDDQPNYAPGEDRSVHVIGLVNGKICPTKYAIGSAEFEEPALGKTIYEEWHKRVEELCGDFTLDVKYQGNNEVLMIDDRTWHSGQRAVAAGWRWFGRVSRYFDRERNSIPRRNPRTNELRRQVQVYLDNPFKGW